MADVIGQAGEMPTSAERAVHKVNDIVARIERLPLSGWHIRTRLVVGIATFFDAFDTLSIAYVLPALIRPWGLSLGQVGLAISMGYVGQLAGALLSGRLAERYGRLRMAVFNIVVFSLLSLLLALSWNFASLLVFRTLQGIGLGGEVPLAATYISELTKAKGRGKFVLLYELIFPLGLLGVALAGYWIVPHWGWRPLFVIGGLAALLVFYLRTRLPESPRWLASVGRTDEAEAAMVLIEERVRRSGAVALPSPEERNEVHTIKQTRWRELLECPYRRRTLLVWMLWFSVYLAAYGLTTWLPSLYTLVYHLPLQQAFGYSLATSAAGFVGALVCALLIDRLGRRFWLASALLTAGVFLCVLWFLGRPSAREVLLWSVLAYLFISSVALALYLYTPELYPTRMRALGSSTGSAWSRLASIVGPLMVGFLLTRYTLGWVFLVFGAVCVVGGGITALFATETRERLLEEVSP